MQHATDVLSDSATRQGDCNYSIHSSSINSRRSTSSWAIVVVLSFAILSMIPTIKGSPVNSATEYQGLGLYNVTPGGGRWLTYAVDTGGLGEPINVVISANSDPLILTKVGLDDWFLSIQYGAEFLNVSLGNRQGANLGDGNGELNQTDLLRYNYFDTAYGTLHESVNGGSHVRYWRQNGSQASSGAWFVAASVELPAAQSHMIVSNGYDLGRDGVMGNATMSNGTISPATNRTFAATSQMVQFLPVNSSAGINHAIATDGLVAVLTVKVTSNGSTVAASNANTKSSSSAFSPSRDWSTKFTLAVSTLVVAFVSIS